MPTAQAGHRKLDRHRVEQRRPAGGFDLGDRVGAAGAADINGAIFFGIEVEHDATADDRRVEVLGTGQSGLFIHRAEQLERAVDRVRVVRNCHPGRNTDAVIRAERRAFGLHPVAVDLDLDALGHEVVIDVRVLLTHHVHVALENHGRCIFVARSRRNPDRHAARGVLNDLEATLGSPTLEAFDDLLFVL